MPAPAPPRRSAAPATPARPARADTGRIGPGRSFPATRSFRAGEYHSLCTSIGAEGAGRGISGPGLRIEEPGGGPDGRAATGAPERISTYDTTRCTPGTYRAMRVARSSSSCERAEPIRYTAPFWVSIE